MSPGEPRPFSRSVPVTWHNRESTNMTTQATTVVSEARTEPGDITLTRAFARYQAALELYYVRRTMREFQSARTSDKALMEHYQSRAEQLRTLLGVAS